jgi:hypothetical protein
MGQPHDGDLDRVRADAAIVERLRASDFAVTSPEWAELAAQLINYGYSVCKGWLMTGQVYRAAADLGSSGVRGLSRVPRDLKLQEDDAHDLATTLLEASIERFRLTLREGQWQAAGGASLSTFFIGRCLMQLPDVYERWRRQQDRWAREVIDVDVIHLADRRFSTDPDPADIALAEAELDELLPRERFGDVRFMIKLSQSGYTMSDIAKYFTDAGTPHSEAKVRTSISRARKWARERRDRNERGDTRER